MKNLKHFALTAVTILILAVLTGCGVTAERWAYIHEPEEEILSLAGKVRGWGRIHCIDFLEPAADTTKDWLFLNGVDNDVVPAYSAWTVYEKADVEERMKKETFTYEEVHALLLLTAALLDEGPVSGISNMDDPDSFLKKVLSLTEGHTLTDEDKDIIDDISNRLSDH